MLRDLKYIYFNITLYKKLLNVNFLFRPCYILFVETPILIPYLISPLESFQSAKVYLWDIWLIGCGKRNPRRQVWSTLTRHWEIINIIDVVCSHSNSYFVFFRSRRFCDIFN